MTRRRLAREYCIQALYLIAVGNLSYQKVSVILKNSKENFDTKTQNFVDTLLSGTNKHSSNLNKVIAKYAKNWTLQRMPKVDRCILNLAGFELLHMPETPVAAIIDEAIELAKKYSTEKSGKFINGVLDKIKNERNVGKNV